MMDASQSMILANVALPAFLPHSLATLVGILVIATIEGWFLMRKVGEGYADCYLHSLAANWRSTVVGIPLAWLLWVAGIIPIGFGLSALGLKSHPLLDWTVVQTVATGGIMPNEWTEVASSLAWIVTLVPFFFGSVWIERRTIRRRLPECEPAAISKGVIHGNLASYSVFLLMAIFALFQAIEKLPDRKLKNEGSRARQKEAAAKRALDKAAKDSEVNPVGKP